jgi:predicted TIM-barrel fold metal-dependent hydrolase
MKKTTPEAPLCSPIPFRTGSNGELVPAPVTARDVRAEAEFKRIVETNSRRLGVSRREFIDSACGTATALLVINSVYGCGDGGYDVPADAAIDGDQACNALAGDQFIFDVQTHHVNPAGAWRGGNWDLALGTFPYANCGETDKMTCFDREHYIREMFINSDTHVAVLSAVPAQESQQPLTRQETAETRNIIEALQGSPRLYTHGLVLPQNGQAELDGMQNLKESLRVAAWKSYTQFGGWRFTDARGIAFVEKALALNTDIICTHKGLSLFGLDPQYASAADMGPAATMFPAMRFVIYHSGYETDFVEGPYNPASTRGVDTLIKGMLDNGLAPGSNIYAELGSTWRALMTKPDQAQHVIGKMLKYVGEDRLLWGTDSIWYGSPQDQISAFRAFQISQQFQDMYGYPALTDAVKAKIFGLNAAALYKVDPMATRCAIAEDDIAKRKRELDRPAVKLRAYGPQTRREFFAFLKQRDGEPG